MNGTHLNSIRSVSCLCTVERIIRFNIHWLNFLGDFGNIEYAQKISRPLFLKIFILNSIVSHY